MRPAIPLAVLTSTLVIAFVQHRIADACALGKEHDDVYLLPPPEQLDAMSLGYRAALADLMWANVLVTQGFRLQEKRHYDTLVPLLEGITSLDPQFREPYLYSDALITFQSVPSTREDALAARHILELGVHNRPLDAEMWLNLGTFVCFLAPSSILTDHEEQQAWRQQGALDLERAVELSGNNSDLAFQALGGGVRFERMGERDAAIRFFRKVLQTTDNEELRAEAQTKLDRLLDEAAAHSASDAAALHDFHADEERQRLTDLEALRPDLKRVRRRHYAGLPWEAMMILGPPRPAPLCAGADVDPWACASTWKTWAETRQKDVNVR